MSETCLGPDLVYSILQATTQMIDVFYEQIGFADANYLEKRSLTWCRETVRWN